MALVHVQTLRSPRAGSEAGAAHATEAAWSVFAAPGSTGRGHAATFVHVNAVCALRAEPETGITRTGVATGPRDAASWAADLGIALTYTHGGT